MKEVDLSKLEETVNRYLKSKNEDYVNDFNHMVKVFEDYGMNDGKLVDKVVKHYYNKLLVDGKLAKDYTSYDKQQVINGKTVLEQWVGAVDNEKRIEYLTLFNSIYQKANIPTKVCLYGHKERKNYEFSRAMQLRGEKIKKEDFTIPTDDEGSAKPFSEILSKINSMGEAMVKNVHKCLPTINTQDALNDVYQFIDSYTTQCMDLIKAAHNIQCDKQQAKNNYIGEMITASKCHIDQAHWNIEIFVKNSTEQVTEQVTSPNIEVIDGMEFMNDFK